VDPKESFTTTKPMLKITTEQKAARVIKRDFKTVFNRLFFERVT
jgi:hypothetical protein